MASFTQYEDQEILYARLERHNVQAKNTKVQATRLIWMETRNPQYSEEEEYRNARIAAHVLVDEVVDVDIEKGK